MTGPGSGRRPHIVVVSHVVPARASSGQQQRVKLLNEALRKQFEVTFVTSAAVVGSEDDAEVRATADRVVVLPHLRPRLRRAVAGAATSVLNGGKRSNFEIGTVLFPAEAVVTALEVLHRDRPIDLVLFHYCHATSAARAARAAGFTVAVDLHDVLARSREEQLARVRPAALRRWVLSRYERWEKEAWRSYDLLIAISPGEHDHVARTVPGRPVLCAPMGTDISRWPYSWSPPTGDPIVAYYGGLGSERGAAEARRLHDRIMPIVWREHARAQLWIVGSNPPQHIRALADDARVRVTGFVSEPDEMLAKASVVVCPFVGRYGFRSRLVEVLAIGTPLVATHDALAGMDFTGASIRVGDSDEELAGAVLELVGDAGAARRASLAGRAVVEERYSLEATYGVLVDDLRAFASREVPA